MPYTLSEVNCKSTRKEFLQLPLRLYEDSSNWIRPLDTDIEGIFNPQKNKRFRKGNAIRWILKDASGDSVGRVAAFWDESMSNGQQQPTGGMGFFECINCKDAATILFDACKQWLAKQGMQAMDGPINFGERHQWWGLHTEGDYEPNYCMGYHHSYYKEFFEDYGFKTYFKQFTYHMPIDPKCVKPVMWEKASRIVNNPEHQVKNIKKKNLEAFAHDFVEIYNKAWSRFEGVGKMNLAQARLLMRSIKPIMDERLMLFAYHQNQPIGFLIMVPELNQILKHLNGRLNLIGKLKLIYLLKYRKICTKALGLIFGIIPKYQGRGIEGALVKKFADNALSKNYPYTDIEMNWIGDFNPTMCKMVEQVGATIRKVHLTYRYMFDQSKEVVPPKKVS